MNKKDVFLVFVGNMEVFCGNDCIAEDFQLKPPVKIEPLNSFMHESPYWRVQIVFRKISEVVGFLDLRDQGRGLLPKILRIGKFEISASHINNSESFVNTIDMSLSEIRHQIKQAFGKKCEIKGVPKLVFDGAETKIGWKVIVENSRNLITAIVTPAFTYQVA